MALALREAGARLRELGASELYFQVLDAFAERYPDAGEVVIARAPGRVNIIGEHTDYNGLPVFPMAIDREIVIIFEPVGSARVEAFNVDSTFPPLSFDLSGEIPPYDMGHWGNYVKAAAQAAWRWAAGGAPEALPLNGFRGVIGGSIPSGSGLSSSSAMVVANAVALMRNIHIEKPELADVLAKGEHYVGTEGGGMDQAVSLLNKKGFATKIDFSPLRTRPVRLPSDHVVIVANSMVSAKKTGGAREAYNTRVAECKIGLEMLKHNARLRYPAVDAAILLRDFVQEVPEWDAYVSRLPDGAVTVQDITAYLGLSEAELSGRCLTRRDGTPLPVPETGFEPKKRCRHVLTEGARVEKAAEASESGDAELLGRLMDESHASCADDYEISCPELNELVTILRKHGALGARLTGAGFGGCAVALVRASDASVLIENVWHDYFQTYLPARGIKYSEDRESVLFACSPNEGAGILEI